MPKQGEKESPPPGPEQVYNKFVSALALTGKNCLQERAKSDALKMTFQPLMERGSHIRWERPLTLITRVSNALGRS